MPSSKEDRAKPSTPGSSASSCFCGVQTSEHHCTGSDWVFIGKYRSCEAHHGRKKYQCMNCSVSLGCSTCQDGPEDSINCTRCGHGVEEKMKVHGVDRDVEYEYLKRKAAREKKPFNAKPPPRRFADHLDDTTLASYKRLMGIRDGRESNRSK